MLFVHFFQFLIHTILYIQIFLTFFHFKNPQQQIIDNSCLQLDDISAKDWGNYSFNGESCQTHINTRGGMSRVIDKLEEFLRDHIKLKKVVDFIDWSCEEATKEKFIKIRTENGEIFAAKAVICTISVGVLKNSHSSLFSPPLPKMHQNVIENIGFGTINKIFLHFDEKWWKDDWQGLQMVWKEKLTDVS